MSLIFPSLRGSLRHLSPVPLSALPAARHISSLRSPLDGCGRAARRDAARVARGRCGAGEEGASLGGERREEAPGRSRGCQLRPSRASALCGPAGSQPCGPVGRQRGPPESPPTAGATGWVFTPGRHPPPRALRRTLSAASVTAAAPPDTPPSPSLRERSARRPRPEAEAEEEEEGSRRGLVWPPRPARPAPALTPSPASYFRTRKVRAAPGDSAAAPVPGSRVCSRVARRTVQTLPWLRPLPAPGSPTSISSSRSSESKRPCLASPPRDPSSPSWGPGARGPRRGDRPWLGAGGAQRGGNLCPTVADAPKSPAHLLGSSTSPRET